MFEWGYIAESKNSTTKALFPTAFVTVCSTCQMTKTGSDVNGLNMFSFDTTGVIWKSGGGWNDDHAYFLAIGY